MTPASDHRLPPVPEDQWGDEIRGYLGGPVGEHCATWTPAVACAVAGWLDACADVAATYTPTLALNVARTYLAGAHIETKAEVAS